jgi:hypothetical protein
MIFVGVDWAEAHHDVCVLDEQGRVLDRRRVLDSLEGLRQLVELAAEHAEEPSEVVVGIETDRGLMVSGLVAAGFDIFAINPKASSRYRERHHTSGSKSDPGDAKMLADLVRTDRQNHRRIAADSNLAEGIKILARAHQNAIWSRQRQVNGLRTALREYFPAALVVFGNELAHMDAVAVLAVAPTPSEAKRLSVAKVISALRRGGRQRNLERRAKEIVAALREEQLSQSAVIEHAYGLTTASSVRVIVQLTKEITELESALSEHFERHPAAKIILSLPGLGTTLGGRVLGEFGDAPNRYADAKSRRNYAGTSPVTKASGRSKVVLARHSRNKRLADALDQWSFTSLQKSPGARSYYDELRRRQKSHRKAVRQVANRWVGILHACLERGCLYDEEIAWPKSEVIAA